MSIKRFEDIESWRKGRECTRLVYEMSSRDKFARDFALRDQIRRASISVMSNIAEGFERSGDREFINFLSIAKGSCGEARAQLYVALDQYYITEQEFSTAYELFVETSRLISGFMKYLQQSELKGSKFK